MFRKKVTNVLWVRLSVEQISEKYKDLEYLQYATEARNKWTGEKDETKKSYEKWEVLS